MAQSTWERLAAGTGLMFVVLLIVSFEVNPVGDALGDEASVVAERLLDNQARALVSVAVGVLAAFALVWFAASLRSTLRQAEGEAGVLSEVAFAGGVMAGVTIVASSALTRTAAEFVDAKMTRKVPALLRASKSRRWALPQSSGWRFWREPPSSSPCGIRRFPGGWPGSVRWEQFYRWCRNSPSSCLVG